MKMLVFSDTHGVTRRMEEGIAAHLTHGGVDLIVHLGDGTADFETVTRTLSVPCISVAGNHEEFSASFMGGGGLCFERKFELGGVVFLAVHGHKLNVKSGIQRAVDHAEACGADVLLFGHTHSPCDMAVDASGGRSVRTINPGSAGRWYNSSYALINVVDGQVVCGFA